MVGLRISSRGLRSSLGLAQADLLESHTCQLWRRQGSHTPTLGLSFPFYKGSKDAELPELSWSLGAQHSAWELLGWGPRPLLPPLNGAETEGHLSPPPHPAAPPQPCTEGRAKPPPRRPRPRGDSELMQGECSQVGVSKRRARRGGAARRGGSACPRALSRQRAEAGEAALGPTDPDTSSSGCLTGRAGCQAWARGLEPWGELAGRGGGWQESRVGARAQRKDPRRICSRTGDTCVVLHPSLPGGRWIIPFAVTEHQLYASPWASSWLAGQGLGVERSIWGHLWPCRNFPSVHRWCLLAPAGPRGHLQPGAEDGCEPG